MSNFQLDKNIKDLSTAIDPLMLSLVNFSNMQQVLEKLYEFLPRALWLENKFFRTLGKVPFSSTYMSFNKPQLNDRLIMEYVQQVNTERVPVVIPPLPQYGVNQSRFVFPVIVGTEIVAYLHIFDKANHPSLNKNEIAIIRSALTAIGIRFIRDTASLTAENSFWSTIYSTLLFKSSTESHIIDNVTNLFNIDLEVPTWMILAHFADGHMDSVRYKSLRSFFLEVEQSSKVFTLKSNYYLILIRELGTPYKKADIISMSKKVTENVNSALDCPLYLAFGRKCFSRYDYPKSYQESLVTLTYLMQCCTDSQVMAFDTLGITGLISAPGEVEQALSFAKKLLDPLIKYDELYPSIDLLHTLDCYIRNNTQIQKTSKDLFIHVNTLRYRLDKIREIAGYDLDDAELRFELFFALKVLNLRRNLTVPKQ